MGIVFENVHDLDLRETLDCGQCFRWKEQTDGSFAGVVRGKAARVSMDGDRLIIDGADEADRSLWHDYFDLGLDYSEVKRELSAIHPTLAEAARYAPGIRILDQEPFEALISFIISQNNNIKRITGIVERLCVNFGEPIIGTNGDASRIRYAFSTVERLAALSPDDLAPIRAGFRHRYIIDAARKVADGTVVLESLRTLPYDEARAALMQITGVGVKVADCVLLYGLHRLDGFPLDVWMKRAMAVLFPGLEPKAFGRYAGIAQQYIFHYSRTHQDLFL
ncbi:MAG: DNA-3-methyladenine glycosylase 2 family protein [Ruminococcus sp.]|nr:DNA-3-methyladenine glycosylase 2 family protein [Ruminococcus sp.]